MTLSVAILGATGAVGQKIIKMLSAEDNKNFEIAEVCASDKNNGKKYSEVVHWLEKGPIPSAVAQKVLLDPSEIRSPYALSALPAEMAQEIEPLLAQRGIHIFSNASAMRMNPQVPILIPEVNSPHLELLKLQKSAGKIITNPNCSTVFLAMALAPLLELSPLQEVNVVTLQALSGAGYPGLSSLDVLANTIPYIGGEEEKVQEECKKILGSPQIPATFKIFATCHRVPVLHGHSITIHAQFKDPVTPQQARERYQMWNKKYPQLFALYSENNHPMPAKDLTEDDMQIHIGRLRQGANPHSLALVSLGHNLVRGAAGAAIANMKAFLQSTKKDA